MTIRAPQPEDAEAIASIVRAHNLPREWTWPEGKHGLVVANPRVVAFCILSETIYGLVIEELWEEQTREGFRGLSRLSKYIETIAQQLADERGEPLACGGIVRLDRATHIAALKHRDYTECATILEKIFQPRVPCDI